MQLSASRSIIGRAIHRQSNRMARPRKVQLGTIPGRTWPGRVARCGTSRNRSVASRALESGEHSCPAEHRSMPEALDRRAPLDPGGDTDETCRRDRSVDRAACRTLGDERARFGPEQHLETGPATGIGRRRAVCAASAGPTGRGRMGLPCFAAGRRRLQMAGAFSTIGPRRVAASCVCFYQLHLHRD